MTWAVLAALPYAMLAVGLMLSLYLFLSLKRDVHLAEKRWARQQFPAESSLAELRVALDELRAGMNAANGRPTAEPSVALPAPGMNLSRRAQVLRMSRRGERTEQIASALRIPSNEVALLLKVHQLGP